MKTSIISILVLFGAVIVLSSCSNKQQGGGGNSSQQAVSTNMVIFQLSNPDEAFLSLAKKVKSTDWSAYLDSETAVAGTGTAQVAAAIGMQSANSLLASFLGDSATSEKLANSIKDLASSINLKTSELENLSAKIAGDLKESDSSVRDTKVRSDLNQVRDAVSTTLGQLGNGQEATLLVFGAWIEGVRITSAVVQKEYSPDLAQALNRKSEADYFLSGFSASAPKAGGISADVLAPLTTLRDAMTSGSDHTVKASAVAIINQKAVEIAALLKK